MGTIGNLTSFGLGNASLLELTLRIGLLRTHLQIPFCRRSSHHLLVRLMKNHWDDINVIFAVAAFLPSK